MTLTQIAMAGAGFCYILATIGWWLEGRLWMSATFALYALTAVTVYFAGRAP